MSVRLGIDQCDSPAVQIDVVESKHYTYAIIFGALAGASWGLDNQSKVSGLFMIRSFQRFNGEPSLTIELAPRVLMIISIYCLLYPTGALSQKPSRQDKGEVLEAVTVKTDLYAADADARKEIDEALEKAVKNKKRVML